MAQFNPYSDAGEWQGTGKVILYKGAFRLRMEPMTNVDTGARTSSVEYYIPANLHCAKGGDHHPHNRRGARLCDETCTPRFDALYGRRGDLWGATEPMAPILNDMRGFRIYRKSERVSVAWFLDAQTQTANPAPSAALNHAGEPQCAGCGQPPSLCAGYCAPDPTPTAAPFVADPTPDPTPWAQVDIPDPVADPAVAPNAHMVAAAVQTLGTVERIIRWLGGRQHDGTPVNVNMVGPAGCGKTTMARMVAERLGLTFRILKFTVNTLPHEVMGRRDDVQPDGTFAFRGTTFTESYLRGGVLLLDEFDCADPNTATVLHEPLANGHCTIDGVEHERRDDFYVLAACNTYGSGSRIYVGREKLDEATLSRFLPLSVDYSLDFEAGILAQCADDTRERLAGFRDAVRRAINTGELRRTFSTRHLIQWVAVINTGETLDFLATEYFAAWSANDRDAAREHGAFAFIR